MHPSCPILSNTWCPCCWCIEPSVPSPYQVINLGHLRGIRLYYVGYLVRGRRLPKTAKPLTTSRILLPPVLSSPSIWSVIPNQMSNCSSRFSFAANRRQLILIKLVIYTQRDSLFRRHIFVIALFLLLFTNLLIIEFPSDNIVYFILFHFTFVILCAVGYTYTYVKREE